MKSALATVAQVMTSRSSATADNRFQLVVAYHRTGQARFASHRGQSDRRDRLEVGVTHVR
jgi:septum formation topological specificity factor MinE